MPSRRAHGLLFLGFWLLSALLHVPALTAPHDEGDEIVYQALASEMGWDGTHYTTRDHALVSQFPFSVYQLPVFPHPPLYPYVLKVGQAVGRPLQVGLLFSVLVMGLLLHFTRRLSLLLGTSPRWSIAAYAGISLCPLLLYSTARLHLDGLTGAFLGCAIVATIEALERRTSPHSVIAGALWVATLNLRFTAPLALPILAALQVLALVRRAGATTPIETRRAGFWRLARTAGEWRAFGIVLAMVLTLGLQHYYRVLFTCGTLWPWELLRPDYASPYMSQVILDRLARPRLEVLAALVLIFPALILFVTPWLWGTVARGLGRGRWQALLVLAFVYALLLHLAFLHDQLRYFTFATPLLYLSAPYLLRESKRDGPRTLVYGLVCWSLVSMVGTGLYNTVRHPENASVTPFVSAVLDEFR